MCRPPTHCVRHEYLQWRESARVIGGQIRSSAILTADLKFQVGADLVEIFSSGRLWDLDVHGGANRRFKIGGTERQPSQPFAARKWGALLDEIHSLKTKRGVTIAVFHQIHSCSTYAYQAKHVSNVLRQVAY